jgi:RNA polymerase sigma-70 factor (ECF subfamily)
MREPEDIHDEWLVLRCQDGDATALTELVGRWQPRLWRHAMRLTSDRDAAGDVVQQAWVAIIRGLRRLDDAARFRRWAYQIVTYKSADWVRQRQHERVHVSALTDETAANACQASNVTETELLDEVRVIREAIKRLSPDHRVALSMFYLEQMSVAEIAHVLSLPVGTVKSRLHYARQELKSILERTTS